MYYAEYGVWLKAPAYQNSTASGWRDAARQPDPTDRLMISLFDAYSHILNGLQVVLPKTYSVHYLDQLIYTVVRRTMSQFPSSTADRVLCMT